MTDDWTVNALRRYSQQVPSTFTRVVTDMRQRVLEDETDDSFFSFTGFSRNEAKSGRKMRFMQGPETCAGTIEKIRDAIREERPVSTVLLNYTKSGVPFWNILCIRPCFDRVGRPAFFASMLLLPVRGLMLANSNEFTPKERGVALVPTPPPPPRQCFEILRMLTAGPRAPSQLRAMRAGGGALQRHQRWSTDAALTPRRNIINASEDSEEEEEVEEAPVAAVRQALPPVATQCAFVAETMLPTTHGTFRVRAYRDEVSGAEPIAFIVGDVGGRDEAVVVRVHDQCVTSEVFGSLKCDCKQQLDAALARVQASPPGMLIYLPQEGRGIGLANKIAAYDLQTRCGLDTVDANRALGLPDDAREYGAAASILRDVQVRRVALLTNNPRKVEHLRRLGVEVSRRVPHFVAPSALPAQANAYVRAKVARMGHVISGIVEQV